MRRPGKRTVLMLLGAWLLVSGVLGSTSWSAPLTVWASGSLLGNRAHFETLPASQALQALAGWAAGGSLGPGSPLAGLLRQDAPRPEALVVFVSSQRSAAAASQLQAVAAAAGSWLQLPNAVHQGAGSLVVQGLQAAAGRGAGLQVLGSCSGAPAVIPATPEAVRQHLGLAKPGAGGLPALAVVCSEGGSAEEEAALLAATQAAVAAQTDKFVMVHLAQGGSGSVQAQQRRRLLQSGGSSSNEEYTECDAKCQTQVKYLEAFIVFVTIAIALGVGFCCMHAINTPTRFETPKEHRTAHHE